MKEKNLNRKENGITLIALVITIIVLLILAGVAISMLSGENGILKQAAKAKMETERQSTVEQIKLGAMAAMINQEHKIRSKEELESTLLKQGIDNAFVESLDWGYKVTVDNTVLKMTESGEEYKSEVEINQGKVLNLNENTPVKDEYGNTIMVPAGFAITKDTAMVEKGIVVTDEVDEYGNSIGNEFVWIPINEVKTSKGIKTVTLGRYKWSKNIGTAVQTVTTEEEAISAATTAIGIADSGDFLYYEVTTSDEKYGSYKNKKAKDLEKFLKSTVNNGGYYLARYEAGIVGTKDNNSLSKATVTDGTIVPQSKKGLGVWNGISQINASKVSKAMYTSTYYTSDLLNSYAWDTAIVFIQEMNDDLSYAVINGKSEVDTRAPQTTGTNKLIATSNVDVQCNIYDMAGNVSEWTTETYGNDSQPATRRSGWYGYTYPNVTGRQNWYHNDLVISRTHGFRTILYL